MIGTFYSVKNRLGKALEQAMEDLITKLQKGYRKPFDVDMANLEDGKERKVMHIIQDKISLPTESPRLSRTRLLNRLTRSLAACNSTVINGRAGSGKTLLAADFARRCGRQIAWYKVDASDSDPRVFFHYLIASIREHRPNFYDHWLEQWLKLFATGDIPLLAESFVYELLQHTGEPLLIVLDDLHRIYDEDWVMPFFSRLAPLLPAEAHLMILGRILPPAPLWRMRSKQTLSVIDELSLAFTLEETASLCVSQGVSEAAAAEIYQQSRGRAMQVQALIRQRGSSDPCGTCGHLPQQVFV
jgi:LuxR family maltose regulon positive regulatory protein